MIALIIWLIGIPIWTIICARYFHREFGANDLDEQIMTLILGFLFSMMWPIIVFGLMAKFVLGKVAPILLESDFSRMKWW